MLLAALLSVNISWGVRITMRDGVHLNATVYTSVTNEKAPVSILELPVR